MNTYNYLDLVPRGRDEDALSFTMSWLCHHDRYDSGYLADVDKPYWPADAVPVEHSSAPQAGSWPVLHKMTSGQSRQEEIFQLNTNEQGVLARPARVFQEIRVQMGPELFPQLPI